MLSVIIPAAGRGQRFQARAHASKIEWPLAGQAMTLRAAELFLGRDDVAEVLIAVAPDRLETLRGEWGDRLSLLGGRVVAGGKIERWETVLAAMDAIRAEPTHIAVHDAARPLTSQALIDRVVTAAKNHDAVVPGLAVADTLKRVTEPGTSPQATPSEANDVDNSQSEGQEAEIPDLLDALLGGGQSAAPPMPPVRRVTQTVSREGLVAVQTPQLFDAALFRRAYEPLRSGEGPLANGITDDASLIEALGEPVHVVEGESTNLKLTRPEDAALAEAVLAQRDNTGRESSPRRYVVDDDDEW
jgi:2-C-methyl-D-erythritol 4-phosphate cytidylyltransferase